MRRSIEERAVKFGQQCSGLFQSFLRWVIKNSVEDEISKVYFLTREGEFFQAVLNEMAAFAGIDLECDILNVSRVSTFLPSLKKLDSGDWDRFLNQYKEQSLASFVRSVGTPYDETIVLLRRNGLHEDTSVADQLQLFYQTVTSEDVRDFFRKKSAEALGNLKEYLVQKGIDEIPGKIAVVDIGWRGTIQDNLCYILPQKTIYGYYLGMIPVLNAQPDNAIKKGFINGLPFANALLKSHTQLEMLCSSQRGSVLTYREAEDGAVVPVEDDNTQDIYSWNRYTKYFQEGLLKEIRENVKANSQSISEETESKHLSWKETVSLLRMTLFPDKELAKAFFSFRYSERFGLGTDIDQSKLQFSWEPFLNAIKGKKGMERLRLYLNKTMWPQGFLRIHGLSALIPFYNIVLLIKP